MTYMEEPPKNPNVSEYLESLSADTISKIEMNILAQRLDSQSARLRMVEKVFEGRIEEQRLTNSTLFNYIKEMRATIPHMERLMDRLLIQEKRLDGLYEINTAILTQIKELEERLSKSEEPQSRPLFGIPEVVPLSNKVTRVTDGENL